MGRTPKVVRKNALQSLMPHHRAMARSTAAGATPADLAKRYGASLVSLSRILNSPLFKAEVARHEERLDNAMIDSELSSLKPRSVEVIAEDLFRDEPSQHRTDVAFKLLGITGHHPRNEHRPVDNRRMVVVNLTPSPGEDPKEAIRRIELIKDVLEPREGEPIDI